MQLSRFFSALAVFCAASAKAEILGGPIYNAATGHAYYILTPNSWANSENEAMRLGGHLVTINDAAEQDWVYSTFARFNGDWRNLWIGFNDLAVEGAFTWASGETSAYSNWYTEEPNNAGGNENYAEISFSRSGKWNDVPNTWSNQPWPLNSGIVEIVPLPAPKEIWDATAGLTIIRTTPLHSTGIFDARDAFGGEVGSTDLHDVLFSDTEPTNFVHFIEWRTPSPVTVKSIRLFTGAGDPAGREFHSFVLKAKPIGGASFSAILYRHTAAHPYVLLPNSALFEGNVAPTTAQEFRAEFTTYPNQIARGPRILELDGFDQYLPINFEPLTAQLAVLLKWPEGGTNNYQIQWSSALDPESWFDLGAPMRFVNSYADPITDPRRFYRVLRLE